MSEINQKDMLIDILYMLNEGWTEEEVANIILNCNKGNINLDDYSGFNGTEMSKETEYTENTRLRKKI